MSRFSGDDRTNDCVASCWSCWEQRAWRSEQRAETADVLRACTAFDDGRQEHVSDAANGVVAVDTGGGGGAVSRQNWRNAAAMRCSVVQCCVGDLTELV